MSSEAANSPLVTVAMPVKNRAWCIDRVLGSLARQEYSKEFIQLMFVDDYSTDQTYEKIAKWIRRHRNEYAEATISRERSSIPEARNTCLRKSRGNYVLFWDSDVEAPINGIRTLLNHFVDKSIGIVGLPYDVDKPSLFDLLYRAREPLTPSSVDGVTTGFTMIKKEVTDDVGFFNEKLRGYEDTDYCMRVRRRGYKVIFDPTVRCIHLKPEVFISGRYEERKGVFDYRRFLWFNFTKAPKYMIEIMKSGSRGHMLRTLYYLFLPPTLLVTLFSLATSNYPPAVLGLTYLGVAIVYHLRKTRGLFYGLVALAIFIPAGVALAYGVVFSLLKSGLRVDL